MAIESIGKTFVIICTFLGVLALLVTGAFSIIGESGLSQNEHSIEDNAMLHNAYSTDQLTSIYKTYDFLSPVVYQVEDLTHGSYWADDHAAGFIFTDAPYVEFTPITNDDRILMYLTVETKLDSFHVVSHPVYLYFHQAWGGVFGIGDRWTNYQIGWEQVIANYNETDGVAYIDIQLKEMYTLIITPAAGTTFYNDWKTHSSFSISMAQTSVNASAVSGGDAFMVIGQIMTFSVPDVGPWVNLILAAALIPTYTILIFFVIRSFIPWLGG